MRKSMYTHQFQDIFEKDLHKFQHYLPLCKLSNPHQWKIPQYCNRLKTIRKSTSRVIPNLSLIKILPQSAPTADRMVTFQLNTFKTPRERATKVSQKIWLVAKNFNLMTWTIQSQKNLNNLKHGVKSRGGIVMIPPYQQRWKMSK